MLMLCLIPAIMSAIAVVREKETGSIANFRSTPITKFEFLIGKQLPYAGGRYDEFRFSVPDGDFHVPRADQGPVSDTADRNDRLCRRDNRFRPVDIVFHPHAGRGGLRNRDPLDCSRREFLGIVRASVVAIGRRENSRPDLPVRLVSADHRRSLRQGARHARPLAKHCRYRNHRLGLSSPVARASPQAGGVTCLCLARIPFQNSQKTKKLTLARPCRQYPPPRDQGAEKYPRGPDDADPCRLCLQHLRQYGRDRRRDRGDQSVGRHRR